MGLEVCWLLHPISEVEIRFHQRRQYSFGPFWI